MSKVAAMSLFRDSSQEYIQQYLKRARALSKKHKVDFFLVEGDSVNDTHDALKKQTSRSKKKFRVFKSDSGLPHMGSTVHDIRFKCLTRTANPILDVVAEGDYDYFWFIDSDLLYKKDILDNLIALNLDVAAPLFMAAEAFYDIWGYRHQNGASVGPHLDWIDGLNPIRLSSAGGCVLFRHEYLKRGARMTMTESIVGLCKECAERGAKIWMTPKDVVWHPVGGAVNDYGAHMQKWGHLLPGKGEFDGWLSFGERTEHKGALQVDIRPVADLVEDIRKLSFKDGRFDGVECYHVIEHLLPGEALGAVAELHRVMKPGATLDIATPDLAACARLVLQGNTQILLNIFSPHEDEEQRHRWGYTPQMLKALVAEAGFVEIEEIPSAIDPNEVRLRCKKPS
jgi:predicted SAM-dependent methyltransferase